MPGNPLRGYGFDDLVVPFIFVPDGDPEPTEWLARHPDYIKERAKFVSRTNPNPFSLRQPGPDFGGPDFPDPAERPPQTAAPLGEMVEWPADPIGDYLRVDAVLRGNGFGLSGWPDQPFPKRSPAIRQADASAPPAHEALEGARKAYAQLATDVATDASPGGSAIGAVKSGYVAANPELWKDRPSIGTGECVPLVQQATGAPRSTQWRPGEKIQGNADIPRGAAIATFDGSGRYTGHAAIYLGQTSRGIQVIDQWNVRRDGRIVTQHTSQERTIRFNNPRGDIVDQGENYRAVR